MAKLTLIILHYFFFTTTFGTATTIATTTTCSNICWPLSLFVDTGTSNSQIIGTLAPGISCVVAYPLVDWYLDVDGLGDHVLYNAILACGILDHLGLSAFCDINPEKKRKRVSEYECQGAFHHRRFGFPEGHNRLSLCPYRF